MLFKAEEHLCASCLLCRLPIIHQDGGSVKQAEVMRFSNVWNSLWMLIEKDFRSSTGWICSSTTLVHLDWNIVQGLKRRISEKFSITITRPSVFFQRIAWRMFGKLCSSTCFLKKIRCFSSSTGWSSMSEIRRILSSLTYKAQVCTDQSEKRFS